MRAVALLLPLLWVQAASAQTCTLPAAEMRAAVDTSNVTLWTNAQSVTIGASDTLHLASPLAVAIFNGQPANIFTKFTGSSQVFTVAGVLAWSGVTERGDPALSPVLSGTGFAFPVPGLYRVTLRVPWQSTSGDTGQRTIVGSAGSNIALSRLWNSAANTEVVSSSSALGCYNVATTYVVDVSAPTGTTTICTTVGCELVLQLLFPSPLAW